MQEDLRAQMKLVLQEYLLMWIETMLPHSRDLVMSKVINTPGYKLSEERRLWS